MCELQRTLDNEWKLQEFLGVKGQYRDTGDLNTKKDAKRQNRQDEVQKKVAEYTHILELIKQFTGKLLQANWIRIRVSSTVKS